MIKMHKFFKHLVIGSVLLLSMIAWSCTCTKPAEFKVSDVTVIPAEVTFGETVTVTANIENVGGSEDVYTAVLIVDDQEFARKDVIVSPKSSKIVNFELASTTVGSHKVKLGVLSKAFIVKEAQPVKESQLVEEVRTLKFSDLGDDLFDKDGNHDASDPYLDILETELSFSDRRYTFKIKPNGQLPAGLSDPSISLEWGVLLDTDCSTSTGWNWPLICNNIGPDYFIRIWSQGPTYRGAVLDIKAQKWGDIECNVDNDVFVLSCLAETIGKPLGFHYVVAARKYRETDSQQELIIADKSPNEGRYAFPDSDGDTYCDYVERSVYGTDPQVAEKWDDIDTVGNILNTPERVSLWLMHEFADARRSGETPIDKIFRDKWGDCDEFAMLATHWLAQNGYEAYNLIVDLNEWWQEYNCWMRHYVCAYKGEGGSWYSIDLYFHGSGNPAGPFNSIEEILNSLPPHYGATDWVGYELRDSNMKLLKETVRTPTPTPMPTPTPTPETKSVKIADPSNDMLDKNGNPTDADPGMDIVEAQVSSDNQNYIVKIKVKDNIPSTVDAPAWIEWNILVDSDLNPGTGWSAPLLFNDIGVDYYIFGGLSGQQFSSILRDTETNQWIPISYTLNGDTIELSFPKSDIGGVEKFNFTIAVRKYGKKGDANSLISFDKAPNKGHGQFP